MAQTGHHILLHIFLRTSTLSTCTVAWKQTVQTLIRLPVIKEHSKLVHIVGYNQSISADIEADY